MSPEPWDDDGGREAMAEDEVIAGLLDVREWMSIPANVCRDPRNVWEDARGVRCAQERAVCSCLAGAPYMIPLHGRGDEVEFREVLAHRIHRAMGLSSYEQVTERRSYLIVIDKAIQDRRDEIEP